MDGLRFPLIIHNPNEPYKYDQELTVTVSGKLNSKSMSNCYLSLYILNRLVPQPKCRKSCCIHECLQPHWRRARTWYEEQLCKEYMSIITDFSLFLESGLINDNANVTFNFTPGKKYRLHLINMSGFATFFYSIDGHQMEIIEVDGVSYYK